VGWVKGIPSLTFTDTENAKLANWITFPFTNSICTPSCYTGELGPKHLRYNGYQELAYTHPNWFSADVAVLDELDLKQGEPLFVVRFVAWQSGHDVMLRGFSQQAKHRLVQSLSRLGRVVITSEGELPAELEPYRMRISPTNIHDLLAFSALYVGESATMASESALLGTPFIFVSPIGRGYTDELEKEYALGYTIHPRQEERAVELALSLAQRKNLREEWQAKRQRLLQDKIDVTAWLVDYVVDYTIGRTVTGV
jgi:predicted glycosyltransferase